MGLGRSSPASDWLRRVGRASSPTASVSSASAQLGDMDDADSMTATRQVSVAGSAGGSVVHAEAAAPPSVGSDWPTIDELARAFRQGIAQVIHCGFVFGDPDHGRHQDGNPALTAHFLATFAPDCIVQHADAVRSRSRALARARQSGVPNAELAERGRNPVVGIPWALFDPSSLGALPGLSATQAAAFRGGGQLGPFHAMPRPSEAYGAALAAGRAVPPMRMSMPFDSPESAARWARSVLAAKRSNPECWDSDRVYEAAWFVENGMRAEEFGTAAPSAGRDPSSLLFRLGGADSPPGPHAPRSRAAKASRRQASGPAAASVAPASSLAARLAGASRSAFGPPQGMPGVGADTFLLAPAGGWPGADDGASSVSSATDRPLKRPNLSPAAWSPHAAQRPVGFGDAMPPLQNRGAPAGPPPGVLAAATAVPSAGKLAPPGADRPARAAPGGSSSSSSSPSASSASWSPAERPHASADSDGASHALSAVHQRDATHLAHALSRSRGLATGPRRMTALGLLGRYAPDGATDERHGSMLAAALAIAPAAGAWAFVRAGVAADLARAAAGSDGASGRFRQEAAKELPGPGGDFDADADADARPDGPGARPRLPGPGQGSPAASSASPDEAERRTLSAHTAGSWAGSSLDAADGAGPPRRPPPHSPALAPTGWAAASSPAAAAPPSQAAQLAFGRSLLTFGGAHIAAPAIVLDAGSHAAEGDVGSAGGGSAGLASKHSGPKAPPPAVPELHRCTARAFDRKVLGAWRSPRGLPDAVLDHEAWALDPASRQPPLATLSRRGAAVAALPVSCTARAEVWTGPKHCVELGEEDWAWAGRRHAWSRPRAVGIVAGGTSPTTGVDGSSDVDVVLAWREPGAGLSTVSVPLPSLDVSVRGAVAMCCQPEPPAGCLPDCPVVLWSLAAAPGPGGAPSGGGEAGREADAAAAWSDSPAGWAAQTAASASVGTGIGRASASASSSAGKRGRGAGAGGALGVDPMSVAAAAADETTAAATGRSPTAGARVTCPVMVVGGDINGGGSGKPVYRLDPDTGRWVKASALRRGRRDAQGVWVSQLRAGVVTGGFDPCTRQPLLGGELHDERAPGVWSPLPRDSRVHRHSCAYALDHAGMRLYRFGGRGLEGETSRTYDYLDLRTMRWSPRDDRRLPKSTIGGAAVVDSANGVAYIGGGFDLWHTHSSLMVMNLATGDALAQRLPAMGTGRREHGMLLL